MKRWKKRLLLLSAGMVALFLITLASCSSTIYPPSNPQDPVQVYLLKDAMHVGVVLPDEAERFVEYGFGDWDWYALCRDRWYHVFHTVLWPTQGCIGRTWWGRESVNQAMASGQLTSFHAGRVEVDGLLKALEERFSIHASTLVRNPAYDMYFVQDDQGFWFLHNCHDAVAEWMEALGCEVSWTWIRTDLEVGVR